jgi:NAD+ kinase
MPPSDYQKQLMTIRRIGILYHPLVKAAAPLASKLRDIISSRGVPVWLGSSWEGETARTQLEGTDLIISVGGDGTILRCARIALGHGTPIIGVNLGKLGFMTELTAEEAVTVLPRILAGEGWLDERAMLSVTAAGTGSEAAKTFHGLNDVVVARGAIARMVNVTAAINGAPLTNYAADGVVVATATGSTGYSLALGGPILHPRAEELLLLPIVPHLSMAHPLVLPATSQISLEIKTPHQAALSVDGHVNLALASGAAVNVEKSSYSTRFLRIHPETSFFTSLEQKLRGKRHAA